MNMEAYDPCPCGSGKKLKFCCQAITADMARVERLIQGNQPRLALQSLDSLNEKHPGNPWIGVNRAAILLDQGKLADAKSILEPLVENHPDHLQAIALLATVSFSADGFDLAKPAIHRAFQRCASAFPDMIGNLALGIAASMYAAHQYMGARQHLTLAMRLVSDEEKQDIFIRLLEFDGNRQLPYPLRSVHDLETVAGSEELQTEATKARKLSDRGCWRPAAKIFTKLAEQESSNAALWWNAGLCHAWDGNEVSAAQALHRAAELMDDEATAIEYETLAQLLDYNTTEDVTRFSNKNYSVTSVSQLLTKLDESKFFIRMEIPDRLEGEQNAPVAIYHVVDRPELLEQSEEDITLETIADVIAQVSLFDARSSSDEDDQDLSALAILTGEQGDPLENASKLFQECSGDLATLKPEDSDEEFNETIPRELSRLTWRWQFPEKTPVVKQRELEMQKWERETLENWTNTKLAALKGKTPLEAAQDDQLHIPLAAAVVVLDSYCDRAKYNLQIAQLRERLSLAEEPPLEISEETSLNSFTVMQLQRLPIEQLSDAQLSSMLNRAILIHHGSFLKRVLTEVLKRPACLEHVDLNRVYMALVDLCLEQGNREEALDWVARGLDDAKDQERMFESSLKWTFRELSIRLEDPSDSEITPLLERIDSQFLTKLPQLRDSLNQLLEVHDITPPWQGRPQLAGVNPAEGTTSGGGIWTPGDPSPAEGEGGKKLWTPGQD
ncbi:MAG: protein disulfide-isomerase [Planctomycetaceae bacterium]